MEVSAFVSPFFVQPCKLYPYPRSGWPHVGTYRKRPAASGHAATIFARSDLQKDVDARAPGSDDMTEEDAPTQTPEQLYDPVAARVRKELAENGVNMDELLDAGKVVSLTRDLDKLTAALELLTTDEPERQAIECKLNVIQKKLEREKRLVMQTWLKQLFLAQALVFIVLGGLLSTNSFPGVGEVPLVGKALGFWMVWLFTIPALRARKGLSKQEKSALNVAFVATPLLNIALPVFTKNCGVIWAWDVLVLAASYVYYGALFQEPIQSVSEGPEGTDRSEPGLASDEKAGATPREQAKIKGLLKYLDWGSWR